jgi:hypothetical protein
MAVELVLLVLCLDRLQEHITRLEWIWREKLLGEEEGVETMQVTITCLLLITKVRRYTDKKENQSFLIDKEIQSGAVAKSYMSMHC